MPLLIIFLSAFAGAIVLTDQDPQNRIREVVTAVKQAADNVKPPIEIPPEDRTAVKPPGQESALAGGPLPATEGTEASAAATGSPSGQEPLPHPSAEPPVGAVPGSNLPPGAGPGPESNPDPGPEPALEPPPDLEQPRMAPMLLSIYVKPLMEGANRKARSTAADKILAYAPASDVPEYLLEVAKMQKASSCLAKKRRVLRLAEVGDPRALPALLALSRQRRSGCGTRSRKDCLSCLRRDLTATIEQLEAGSR